MSDTQSQADEESGEPRPGDPPVRPAEAAAPVVVRPAAEIAAGLDRLRFRRQIFWIVVTVLGVAVVLFTLAPVAHHYGIAFGVLTAGLLFVHQWLVLARCPRCGETFHQREGRRSLTTRRCLHCALPLDGGDDDEDYGGGR